MPDPSIAGPGLILLHPHDNILVAIRELALGEVIAIDGDRIVLVSPVALGHKVARCNLRAGDQVIRFGAPIGTMRQPAERGAHVHSHNLRSDYIPAHDRGDAPAGKAGQ